MEGQDTLEPDLNPLPVQQTPDKATLQLLDPDADLTADLEHPTITKPASYGEVPAGWRHTWRNQ